MVWTAFDTRAAPSHLHLRLCLHGKEGPTTFFLRLSTNLTICHLPFATYYLPLAPYYLPLATYHLSLSTFHLPLATCYVLHVTHYLPLATYYVLHVTYYLLLATCIGTLHGGEGMLAGLGDGFREDLLSGEVSS